MDRAASLLMLLAVALVTTCGPSSAAPDGGSDGSVDPLQRRDAPEPAHDAAPRDASHDGASVDADTASPFGWTHLGGLPVECDLRVALHPEAEAPFAWADCGTGCQYLPHGSGVVRGFANDDGRTFYDSLEWVDDGEARALLDHDGNFIALWRNSDDMLPDRLCAIDTVAVGGGRAAVAGHSWINGHPELSVSLIWVAAIEDIGHTVAPSVRFAADLSSMPQRLWVSATHVAVQTSLGLLMVSDGTHLSDPVYVRTDDGPAQDGSLHDDHFIYEDWQTDLVRLAVATYGTAPASILHGADPADVRSFGSDGRDMAWLQGYGYTGSEYTRMELWTAPYATSASTIVARRVREIPSVASAGAAGGGWYAKQALGGGFDAWSLADGTERTWRPPSGLLEDGGPHYVTANEVFVLTNSLPYRIDPNTLPIVP